MWDLSLMNTAKTSHASASTSVNSQRPRLGNVVSWRVESIVPISTGGVTRDQAGARVGVQLP